MQLVVVVPVVLVVPVVPVELVVLVVLVELVVPELLVVPVVLGVLLVEVGCGSSFFLVQEKLTRNANEIDNKKYKSDFFMVLIFFVYNLYNNSQLKGTISYFLYQKISNL